MVVLRFEVSQNFCAAQTVLSFAGKNEKSVSFSAAFDKIESVFADVAFSSLAYRNESVEPEPEATDSNSESAARKS